MYDDDLDDDGEDADLPWNHYSRFDGIPGMVWYSKVEKVRGDQLRVGDWLDSLDHRGARSIWGIWIGEIDAESLAEVMGDYDAAPDMDTPMRTVMFGFGDTETVRVDVEYDVVDPDSQVTPDGTPVILPEAA